MAVPNHESFPAPVQRQKQPPDSAAEFPFSELALESIDADSAAVTNQMIEEFNERNGTDVQPAYTDLPFRKP
jgi:ribonuclease Z